MKFKVGHPLIALLFTFSFTHAPAQQERFKELKTQLDTVTNDSLRTSILYKLSLHSRNLSPEIHKSYFMQGLTLANKLASDKYQSRFLNEAGLYHRKRGNLDSALHYYEQSQAISLELQDTVGYYATSTVKANVYKSQGEFAKAVAHYLNAIRYFETQTTDKYLRFKLMAEFSLANVYITIADYDKGLPLLKKISQDSIANKSPNLMRSLNINLMATYIKTEKLDSALYFGQKAEVLAKRVKSPRSMANVFTNLGAVHEKKHDYKKAQSYFEQALNNFEKLQNKPGIIKSLNNLGNIHTRQKQYAQALAYLLKSQELLRQDGDIYSLKHNYEMLTFLYSEQGAHLKAFNSQQQLMQLKDSILGIEQRQGIEALQTEYETEKKELLLKQATQEKTLAQLSASKSRSQLIQGGTFGGMALITLFSYLILFKAKKQKQLLSLELNFTRRQRELESDFNNAELKALKAQMNPHFLFNAMSSVQGLILADKKKEACSYLARLSGLVRKNLELTARQYVEAAEELELLDTYLKLEQMRLGKSFQYQIEGRAGLDGLQMPAMIIQPFLENAIKHGLLHKAGTKVLTVHFQCTEVLTCTITDNGIGREQAHALQSSFKKHSSFSTEAIARRFDLLQNESELPLGFEIKDLIEQDQPLGTQVILKMPFKPIGDE